MGVHLDETGLLKELDKQGFQVEQTKDGYKVMPKSPGLKPVFFHASTLDKSPRAYKNVLTNLHKLEFIEPEVWRKQRLDEAKEERKRREQAERDAGPYFCGDCDVSKPYPFKRNLARHQQAARHGEYADIAITLPTVKPKVKREPEELKAKRLVRKLKGQVAQVNETMDELITLVEPLEIANHEMRGKLKYFEGLFGEAIDKL